MSDLRGVHHQQTLGRNTLLKPKLRRVLAVGTITAIGAVGFAVPASADDTPLSCDAAVLTAALDAAQADVRAAQEAFTLHRSTPVMALARQVRAEELGEARAADRKADRLAEDADGPLGKAARLEAIAAAKAARAVARAEAKEAAIVRRASLADMRQIIKVDRAKLKAEWRAAKLTLEEVTAYAEACAEVDVEPIVVEEPVVEEPVA